MLIHILAAALVTGVQSSAPPEATAPKPTLAAPFSDKNVVSDLALATATAREDLGQLANNDQTAAVSNSRVSGNVETGSASFSDNAFQNVSGLTVVNANTGNNVAINGAIVLNVAITPAQ
jgi:hypothetical protein